jgi:hypothetical protein
MKTWSSQALLSLLVWCVLAVLYAVLAGSKSLHEALAGLGAVTAATLLMLVVHRDDGRRLLLRPGIRVIAGPMLSVVTDSVRVGMVLSRAIARRPDGIQGMVSRQAFRSGSETPADAGRRGLVTLAASLAPNGFVLHLPGEQEVLVMHHLSPTKPPADRDWPV